MIIMYITLCRYLTSGGKIFFKECPLYHKSHPWVMPLGLSWRTLKNLPVLLHCVIDFLVAEILHLAFIIKKMCAFFWWYLYYKDVPPQFGILWIQIFLFTERNEILTLLHLLDHILTELMCTHSNEKSVRKKYWENCLRGGFSPRVPRS